LRPRTACRRPAASTLAYGSCACLAASRPGALRFHGGLQAPSRHRRARRRRGARRRVLPSRVAHPGG
jgi:hypothetical protein